MKNKDTQEFSRYFENMRKTKVRCSCGATRSFPIFKDRLICKQCGHYIYRTKQLEFEYKTMDTMKTLTSN